MTQQQDTIQSNQKSIRAYSEGGVVTPASGLEEYIIATSDGGNRTINLNNNTPLIIEKVIAEGSSGDFTLTYSNFSLINESSVSSIDKELNTIVKPNSTLNITDTAGDKNLQVQLRRIGIIGEVS